MYLFYLGVVIVIFKSETQVNKCFRVFTFLIFFLNSNAMSMHRKSEQLFTQGNVGFISENI